jgi:hypothetical protein
MALQISNLPENEIGANTAYCRLLQSNIINGKIEVGKYLYTSEEAFTANKPVINAFIDNGITQNEMFGADVAGDYSLLTAHELTKASLLEKFPELEIEIVSL